MIAVSQNSKSIFETHIGFPAGHEASFKGLMASDAIWSEMKFDRIVRAQDSDRYDAHDVPGGIRYLATANSGSYFDAMKIAKSARELVGLNPLARVEIEEVIAINERDLIHDRQFPNIHLDETKSRFALISDFPNFESHLSVKRRDGTTISDINLEAELLSTGAKFNEYAVTSGEAKGIFTMFYDSADQMLTETRRNAEALRSKISDYFIVKASMERILFCASFG